MLWEFYDHLYHSLDKYDAVDNEADVEIEKFNKLKDRCKALENEINLREVNNEESEFCLQKEMEQFSEVEKEFDKVQIKKSNLKEQLETIKNESKTMISKIKKTELDILEGQEQIKILETQVIQDEEMAKIKEQEVLLTSVKDANDELKKQRRDLNRTLQSIKDKEKFITSSLLSILEEIETENTKNKEADSLGNEFKKISLALMEKLGDLSHTRQELIESMNMLQEKRAMLQSTKEVKKNGLLEEIKQLRLNVSELQSSKEKQSSMEKGLVAEIKKYKEEFRTKEIELKYFLSVVDESFNAMLKKISEMDMKKSRGRSLIVG